jgi:hypothetical protein
MMVIRPRVVAPRGFTLFPSVRPVRSWGSRLHYAKASLQGVGVVRRKCNEVGMLHLAAGECPFCATLAVASGYGMVPVRDPTRVPRVTAMLTQEASELAHGDNDWV